MKMGPGRGFSCALGLVLMIKVLAVSAGNDDEPDEYKPAYGEMMEWSRNDYYGMLGIEPNMPHSDLKRYYRRLSLQLHPDKNPNNRTEAHDKFVEVTQGFKVLGNKPRREAYDKFIQQMPSAFRPKYDDKPVMELRTLVLVFIFGISALQFLYWWHRQKQTLERVEGNLRLKQKMDRALRQGKKIVISGAEAPEVENCLFFTLPFLPLYVPHYLWHLGRWFVENHMLGKEMGDGELEYWKCRELGWTKEEYDKWVKERDDYIEKAGGKEVIEAQQKFREQKYNNLRKRWEKYGR